MSKRPKLDHQRTTACNNREETTSEETSAVFEYEYTGRQAPRIVTHARITSSVTKIGMNSFCSCKSLVEVVLNDGLREIGSNALIIAQHCKVSIYHLLLPRLELLHLVVALN